MPAESRPPGHTSIRSTRFAGRSPGGPRARDESSRGQLLRGRWILVGSCTGVISGHSHGPESDPRYLKVVERDGRHTHPPTVTTVACPGLKPTLASRIARASAPVTARPFAPTAT